MKGITVYKNVKIELTANDWDLYDKAGVEQVVMVLNRCLENSLNVALLPNSRLTKNQVRGNVEMQMSMFSEYGACDTEPNALLDKILAEVFGE